MLLSEVGPQFGVTIHFQKALVGGERSGQVEGVRQDPF